MKKILILTIVGLVILIAVLVAVKGLQIGAMTGQAKNFVPPPETVTSAVVKAESWETALTSVGTLNAVRGVTVAAELPGKVVEIYFEGGMSVKKGDILLRQDTSSEEAQLAAILAQVNLNRTNLDRANQLLAKDYISRADRDAAVAAADQAEAQAQNIRTIIAKKTVRAPSTVISASARSTWARFSARGTQWLPSRPWTRSLSTSPCPSRKSHRCA
jgi:membrane fusion protein (multidrug efflux system)